MSLNLPEVHQIVKLSNKSRSGIYNFMLARLCWYVADIVKATDTSPVNSGCVSFVAAQDGWCRKPTTAGHLSVAQANENGSDHLDVPPARSYKMLFGILTIF